MMYKICTSHDDKKRVTPSEPLFKALELLGSLLPEIPLQQSLERLAVTGFVPCHLMHRVMDRIQVEGLGLLGQVQENPCEKGILGKHRGNIFEPVKFCAVEKHPKK